MTKEEAWSNNFDDIMKQIECMPLCCCGNGIYEEYSEAARMGFNEGWDAAKRQLKENEGGLKENNAPRCWEQGNTTRRCCDRA